MFSMGRFSTTILSVLAASPYLSVAAPVRRTLSATDPNVVVLQFASVLEQLETSFYAQALSKFQASDFTSAGFTSAQVVIEQITAISTDEATHTTVLQQELVTLGQTPLQCQFDFASALTDVSTTLTVARLVENVGVGAYLGAAHLLTDPTILTAAASIVTIEARHQTILNMFNSGNAIPNAFDLPLQPNEVLALAGSFVSGCDLGIAANTALTITTTQITIGASLAFSWSGMPSDLSSSGMFCQIMAGGMPVSIAQPISQCTVPDKTAGPLAVWITSDNQPLNNNARDRTNSTTVAGPSIIFVDVVEEQISALVRTPPGSSSPSSGSSAPSESSPSEQSLSETVIPTSTIPVAEATSLLASATGNPMVYMIPAPAANA